MKGLNCSDPGVPLLTKTRGTVDLVETKTVKSNAPAWEVRAGTEYRVGKELQGRRQRGGLVPLDARRIRGKEFI
jgi:hypothetical protein